MKLKQEKATIRRWPSQTLSLGVSLAVISGAVAAEPAVRVQRAKTAAGTTSAPIAYQLNAPGQPRILMADQAFVQRLRDLLSSRSARAERFRLQADRVVKRGENVYAFQPWHAALVGVLIGDRAYCEWAVTRTDDEVRKEESLIQDGKAARVAFDSYLYVGDRIGNLALVYDWCRGQMSEEQRGRWVRYANQAVWNVWNPKQASWGGKVFSWSGWSINNPSNNYYYSFLRATMLLGLATAGENPQAQQWLDTFRVEKIEKQLIPVFERDLAGGGSREGTGYGVAMANLFTLYDLWERSTGERLAARTPHALASMRHMLHSIVPTLDRVAPTGDHARDSSAALFDYHRNYLQVLMRLFPEEPVSGAARTLLEASSRPQMGQGFMYYSDFLYDTSDIEKRPLEELGTSYWGSGTGQFMVRTSWAKDAAYANFICGPYTESHAHRDQGSFVLYKGKWLAFDANLVSKSGIAQGEVNHNLVRIEQGGKVVQQAYGTVCEMGALSHTPQYTYGLMKVTPSYKGHAAVSKVEREFVFLKPGAVVVLDRVRTSGAGVRRIWTLNLPQAPQVEGDRLSMVDGASRLDVIRLAPAGLVSQVVAWPSASADYLSGVRVDVADAVGDQTVFLHVLGADGAVTGAVRDDAQGQLGARLTLADGTTVTVRFNTESSGGSIAVQAPGAVPVAPAALPREMRLEQG